MIIPPAFPTPGYVVFDALRTLLAAREQATSLTIQRLTKMLGVPLSTCYGWFSTDALPHVQALLCLMERIPEAEWRNALQSFLRDRPNLQHWRLMHNRKTVCSLKNLLSEQHGLTLIEGGTYADRAFVLTALGHSFAQFDRLHRLPAGIDVRIPQSFVPIESVIYFRKTLPSNRLNAALHKAWHKLQMSDAPLLLLNGVLSTAAALSSEIALLARRRHIIITDPITTKCDLVRKGMRMALRSLELSVGADNLIHIQLVSQTR